MAFCRASFERRKTFCTRNAQPVLRTTRTARAENSRRIKKRRDVPELFEGGGKGYGIMIPFYRFCQGNRLEQVIAEKVIVPQIPMARTGFF